MVVVVVGVVVMMIVMMTVMIIMMTHLGSSSRFGSAGNCARSCFSTASNSDHRNCANGAPSR